MKECKNTVNKETVLDFRKNMKKIFARRLSKLIKERKDLDRDELAGMLFHLTETNTGKKKADTYSESMIAKWCSAKSDEFPTPIVIFQLADILGCSIDYLYGREDCPTHENTDIHNLTGLSDKAINALARYKNDSEGPLPDRINKSYIEGRTRLERMNIDCINMILEHEEGKESFYNDSILVMIYQYVKSIDPEFCYHDFEDIYDNHGEATSAEDRVTNLEHSITVLSKSMPFGYNIDLKKMYPTVFKDMLLKKIEEYRGQ